MKTRILLKEIPSDKFHSAIFTTYSINLYYLEQQVLPMLGSKGIHYVSVLADGEMLSTQLESLSSMSENKRRTYAIHGIQSKGAFHPKLIFLAGDTSILLLMGSGNLTSSGHGKNLEVWNAFYVDNAQDSKLGFLIQSWSFLKQIHQDLGSGSSNKIKNIEENCSLLKQANTIFTSESYQVNDHSKISFLTSQPNKSMFSQLIPNLRATRIEKITLMTPFYDIKGNLIKLLNDTFKPKVINIILQKEFGNAPVKMNPPGNLHFFDWNDVKCDSVQKFFHAKNIVFEGKGTNFLLSGSANASVAAFGMDQKAAINYEACVLYQSDETDYVEHLGIQLNKNKTDLSLYTGLASDESNPINENPSLEFFIKSAELNYDIITINLSAENKETKAVLCIFDAKGELQLEEQIEISILKSRVSVIIPKTFNVMYCYLKLGSNIASNKQFIVDINAFESTNPSQKNRSLNQIRKIIESEGFSTTKIIDYLNTIYQTPVSKHKISAASDKKEKGSEIIEDESDLLYMPYHEIQNKIKHFDNTKNGKAYVEYKSVRLWDSILSYLKDSRDRAEESLIEEEETENINKSTGRKEVKQSQIKKPISRAVFEKVRFKIEKFLVNYIETLERKIEVVNSEKLSIIDLSMYLIMIEILLQYANSKEQISDDKKEEFLIHPKISNSGSSWSGYSLKIIGLFSLWWNKEGGFKDVDSQEYKDKFQRYRADAFNMSVLAITIFGYINKNNAVKEKIDTWTKLELLNSLYCFSDKKINSYLSNDYLMYLSDSQKNYFTNVIDEELNNNLTFLKYFINKNANSSYIIQTGCGYIYSDRVSYNTTSNRSLFKFNPSLLFLK
jgi:hypothetical protein